MFFLLVYKDTGTFIVMLQQMLANDIKRFVMVYFVFLVGFAQAFFIFGMSGVHRDSDQLRGIAGFLKKVETLFESTLGDIKVEECVDWNIE